MSKLRENFETFLKETVKNKNLFDIPIKEVLFNFYKQGHLDPTDETEEVSMEQVQKIVEASSFIDFIKSCIENPTAEQLEQNDYVEIYVPCTPAVKAKCVAWPDRCEEIGCDGDEGCRFRHDRPG